MNETVSGIRIECKLGTDGIKKGRKEVESEMDDLAEAIENGSEEAAEAMIREFEEAADGIKGLFGSLAPKDDSAAGLTDYIKQVKDARKQLEAEFEELQDSIKEKSKTAGYDPAEDQAALDAMRAQYREYTADIEAATESLRQLKEYESRIGDGSAELKTAVADQDMLSKIQSEQEYQGVLARTEDRMRMIANEAERIAREKGFSTGELLSVNTEYQKLARTQKVLIENQSRFSGKTAAAAGETRKLEKEAKKVEKYVKSSKKNASGIGSAMASGAKKLGKAALAVFGVQAIYSGIQKLSNQYLSQNEELSGQIQSMWNVAGQAIGPLIEKMVDWLTVGVSYANAFIKALTGVDLVARANAAALKKQASATKEAASQLAGFDEINKLSDSSSSSSESALFTTDIDTSGVDQALVWIKGKFQEFASFVGGLFGPSLTSWAEAFINLKTPISETCMSIAGDWTLLKDDTIIPFATYMATDFAPGIYNIYSETIAPIFGDMMKTALEEGARDFEFYCLNVDRYINDILLPAFGQVKISWTDVCKTVSDEWDRRGTELLGKFSTFKERLRDTWNSIYDSILKPIIDKINEKVGTLWNDHLKPLWDNLVGFFSNLVSALLSFWNHVLKPIVDWIVKYFGPIIVWSADSILTKIQHFLGSVTDGISGLITFLSGFFEMLDGWFSGDTVKMKNGFIDMVNGIIKGLNSLWSGLYSAVADVVNDIGGIVSGIGSMLGKDWGWKVPTDAPKIPLIPRLARGGIVNNPGRGVPAVIGEAGREAVLPLDQNTEWMDILADKVFSGGQIVLNIILNGRVIQKEIHSIAELRQFATNGGNV